MTGFWMTADLVMAAKVLLHRRLVLSRTKSWGCQVFWPHKQVLSRPGMVPVPGIMLLGPAAYAAEGSYDGKHTLSGSQRSVHCVRVPNLFLCR